MSNAMEASNKATLMEIALIKGDLAGLTSEQRMSYYNEVCSSLGLNPLTRPFEYIQLNGRLTLYAKKDATDQLRNLRNVSVKISSTEKIDDVFIVRAHASIPGGRTDESVGAVPVGHLKGDSLANAFMKAETKAKRRVTLSICGLGMIDETEVESIPAESVAVAQASPPNALESAGDYVIGWGKKYFGKRIKDIPEHEFAGCVDWAQRQIDAGKADNKLKEFVKYAIAFVDELDAADARLNRS